MLWCIEVGFLVGSEQSRRAKGGQCGLVKPTQDEFLFSWIGVDIAYSKYAARLGGIGLGVDRQLLSLQGQTPIADGTELG
jgi:hypothetical protein